MNRREWFKWSTASVGAAGLPLTAAAGQGLFPAAGGGAGPQAAAQGRNLPPRRLRGFSHRLGRRRQRRRLIGPAPPPACGYSDSRVRGRCGQPSPLPG